MTDVLMFQDLMRARSLGATSQSGEAALPAPAGAGEPSQAAPAGEPAAPSEPRFRPVHLADLDDAAIPPQIWVWDGYVPAETLTLLAAHGGAGKSTVALMLAVCVAVGLPLFGVETTPAPVLYFSAEDAERVVRQRVQAVCRHLGVPARMLADRLHILDATAGDPVLFEEQAEFGQRRGVRTDTMLELGQVIKRTGCKLLIVDNASDTFGANENDRQRVREFVRHLVALVRPNHGAVVLLAHVPKSTSRGLDGGSAESYSGSTAWHNSARSRLTLSRAKDGAGLTLEHEKSNFGPRRDPLRLLWPRDGLPQLDGGTSGVGAQSAADAATRALLRLVHEFTERGEFVSTAAAGPLTAPRLLKLEPQFPKRMRDSEVFDLLRQAERRGWIERQVYRNEARKERERWQVTGAGAAAAGLDGGAKSAPVTPPIPPCVQLAHSGECAPVAPVALTGATGATGAEAPP